MFIFVRSPFSRVAKQSHEDRLSRLNTMAKNAAAAVNEAGARPVRLNTNYDNTDYFMKMIDSLRNSYYMFLYLYHDAIL